ncbi:MAG: hypothetical protein C0524_06050 [Rhodobacter sp.]|nr:hypothetical protein [Rhodobacter sp.]
MTRVVVMGVSGCGKSSIGAAVAARLGARFIDGDHLHPDANIAKMARGEALNDADRTPWLARVGAALIADNTVVACSALKRIYRDQIRAAAGAEVVFLHLKGDREVLLDRVSNRPGHFMPASLLDSQLAILEDPQPDETHLTADIRSTPDQIVANAVIALKGMQP